MKIIPKRCLIAILALLGCIFMSLMEAMGDRAINGHKMFDEDEYLKSVKQFASEASILGIASALGAAIIAIKFGGVNVFGASIGLNAIITFCMPSIVYALTSSTKLYIFCRYMQAFAYVLSIVAMSDIWCRWSTRAGRSRYYAFTYVGFRFDVLIYEPFSQYITTKLPWHDMFYITGILAAIFVMIWTYLIHNDPEDDETLSPEEREYLSERLQHMEEKPIKIEAVPWKDILLSTPVWAICMVASMNTYSIFNRLYRFLLNKKLIEVAAIETTQEFAKRFIILFLPMAGFISDLLRNKYEYDETKIRKLYVCSAYSIGAVLLIVFSCSPNLIPFIIFFSFVELLKCVSDLAILLNVMDVSPQFSSLLCGLYWTFVAIGNKQNNNFITDVIKDTNTAGWDFCLVLYMLLFVLTAALYNVWGSATVQPWNKLKDKEDNHLDRVIA